MEITNVNIRIIKKADSKLKAVASIVIDNAFAVHDIKIIERPEGYFVAMPCRKTQNNEFIDIAHPINSETRNFMTEKILKAFLAEIKAPHNTYD